MRVRDALVTCAIWAASCALWTWIVEEASPGAFNAGPLWWCVATAAGIGVAAGLAHELLACWVRAPIAGVARRAGTPGSLVGGASGVLMAIVIVSGAIFASSPLQLLLLSNGQDMGRLVLWVLLPVALFAGAAAEALQQALARERP